MSLGVYSGSVNKLAIKPSGKWQPAVAVKQAMNAGDRGTTRQDGLFF